MSLVISLTCALLATLLQQWARRYLKITQPRYKPHKRARIRAFFAKGVEKHLVSWTVDALPTLLHLSLFLFFAGLVVFLCNVNLTVFKLVLLWVGFCAALYGCFTCMPIIRHDSPYYTPLSLPTWHIVSRISFSVYQFLRWFNSSVRFRNDAYRRFLDLENSCRKSLVRGMQKIAEETALNSSPETDTRAFMWTFDSLDEDHELERFFSGLPDFRSSDVVEDPLPSLTEEEMPKLYGTLLGLWKRTFTSYLLPASVKDRRALICLKAVDPVHTPVDRCIQHKTLTFHILHVILYYYNHSGPVATEIAKVLRSWRNNMDEDKILWAQSHIHEVLARSQPRDNSWYKFASDELAFSETSLRDYATQGDSLSLLILIHVVRQQCIHFPKLSWNQQVTLTDVLGEVSELDTKHTSSELQHKFCTLWNQIIRQAARSNDRDMVYYVLRPIRNVFLSLHQNTNSVPTKFSASTSDSDDILRELFPYPLCRVSDHRSDSTPHSRDNGVSAALACATPDDPNNTAFVPSITSPVTPPSSTYAPLPASTDALSLANQISVQDSTKPIGQTTAEGLQIPSISLSPVIEHSRTTQRSTSSPSPNLNVSASQSADIAVGQTALSHAPWNDLNVESSPSPTPVLDPILSTGLLSFQAVTRPGLSFVYSRNCR